MKVRELIAELQKYDPEFDAEMGYLNRVNDFWGCDSEEDDLIEEVIVEPYCKTVVLLNHLRVKD